MDDLQALTYFSSLNYISKKLAQKEKSLIKYLGNKWTEYSPEHQEELLNDLCVTHSAREDVPPVADDYYDGLPTCWPTLKLPSGEKIIVDENDIWTWRDEHSGPFSWKSKSQQDLTLLDLEADNLAKTHSKGHKTSESDEQVMSAVRTLRQQFPVNHSSWTKPVIEDFVANCHEDIQTPVHTPNSPLSSRESTSEEINAAFEGSVEDLVPNMKSAKVVVSVSHDDSSTDVLTPEQQPVNEVQVPKGKSKVSKAQSPKKLPHPGLVKKDGKGKLAIDSSQQLLIIHNKDEEGTAFTNPVMEWSSFVGQSSTDPDNEEPAMDDNQEDLAKSSTVEQPSVTSVSEPTAMVMDRGDERSVATGEDSVESTPDHKTQLLKSSVCEAKVEEAEKEEVVYVVDDGAGECSVSSKLVAAPSEDADIMRSGFDFLDNW